MTDARAVRVTFGGCTIAVHADDPEVVAQLRRTYEHMLAPPAATTSREYHITLQRGHYTVGASDGESYSCPDRNNAVRWVRGRLLESWIEVRSDLLWLHASAAEYRGRAVLLPGPRGSGKSTLVTALLKRGLRLLSEDTVPLDPATLEAHPFPRTPEVRENPGVEMPADWLLEAPKRFHDVTDVVRAHPLPVMALVLPRAVRVGSAAIQECPVAETLSVLAQGCWNFHAHGARAADALARLLSGVGRVRVTFGDGYAGADAVLGWLDEREAD